MPTALTAIPLTAYVAGFPTYEEALLDADDNGFTICKHADPTEDARRGLTVEEAVKVAREDASLLYLDA